jgi:hypothetical protein
LIPTIGGRKAELFAAQARFGLYLGVAGEAAAIGIAQGETVIAGVFGLNRKAKAGARYIAAIVITFALVTHVGYFVSSGMGTQVGAAGINDQL